MWSELGKKNNKKTGGPGKREGKSKVNVRLGGGKTEEEMERKRKEESLCFRGNRDKTKQ